MVVASILGFCHGSRKVVEDGGNEFAVDDTRVRDETVFRSFRVFAEHPSNPLECSSDAVSRSIRFDVLGTGVFLCDSFANGRHRLARRDRDGDEFGSLAVERFESVYPFAEVVYV